MLKYMSLGRYCAHLDEVRRKEEEAARLLELQANGTWITSTVAMVTTGTRTPRPWWEWVEDDVTRVTPTTEAPPQTLWDEIMGGNSLQIFRKLVEFKVMPCLAIIGVVVNMVMLLLLRRHKRLPLNVSTCFRSTIVSACLYLTCVALTGELNALRLALDLDGEGYLTLLVSGAQVSETWSLVLTAAAVHSNMKLAEKYSLNTADLPSITVQSKGIKRVGITIGIIAGVYLIPCLPPARILLHCLLPGLFKPCSAPLARVIEFTEERGDNEDAFFVLYHVLGYTLLVFVLPVLVMLWYIKAISDTSTELVRRSRLHGGAASQSGSLLDVVDSGLTVTVTCSVFCSVTVVKLALLLFQLAIYGVDFLGDAGHFFTAVTIVTNLLLVVKSFSYLPVTLAVSIRFRWLVRRALLFVPRLCYARLCHQTQPID